MSEQQVYQRAKRKVESRLGFFIHLIVYISVNTFLVIRAGGLTGDSWAKWPLLGWGIGLLWHALAVFVFPKSESMKERMIQREMEKELDEERPLL